MDKKTLTLSFIAGLATNSILASMTQPLVSFSVFALLTLGLSAYILYQDWLAGRNADSSGWPAVGSFVVGILVYAVMLRLQYQEVGNILLPLLILLGLACWGAYKLLIENTDAAAEA